MQEAGNRCTARRFPGLRRRFGSRRARGSRTTQNRGLSWFFIQLGPQLPMKRTPPLVAIIAVAGTLTLAAQNPQAPSRAAAPERPAAAPEVVTRGIGVYPGDPREDFRAGFPHRCDHLPEPGAAAAGVPVERLRLQPDRAVDHRRHRRDGAAAMDRGRVRAAGRAAAQNRDLPAPLDEGRCTPGSRGSRGLAQEQARVAARRQLGHGVPASRSASLGPGGPARGRRAAVNRPGGRRGARRSAWHGARELDVHRAGIRRWRGMDPRWAARRAWRR